MRPKAALRSGDTTGLSANEDGQIARLPDDTHPTAPEHLDDVVLTDPGYSVDLGLVGGIQVSVLFLVCFSAYGGRSRTHVELLQQKVLGVLAFG